MDAFARLFAYDAWANRETLAALKDERTPEKALTLMAHVVAADVLWWSRIHGVPSALPVWPVLTLSQCVEEWRKVETLLSIEVAAMTVTRAEEEIAYVNSKGESFTSRVDDILTHVLFHSTHHRGQIALELRAAGAPPPYTDFIHAIRQGLLEK